jgi:hypothetical protein
MRDQIAGDDFDPGLGFDDRFELRPFVLSFSVRSTSSPSVNFSNSGSIFGRSEGFNSSLASRLS